MMLGRLTVGSALGLVFLAMPVSSGPTKSTTDKSWAAGKEVSRAQEGLETRAGQVPENGRPR